MTTVFPPCYRSGQNYLYLPWDIIFPVSKEKRLKTSGWPENIPYASYKFSASYSTADKPTTTTPPRMETLSAYMPVWRARFAVQVLRPQPPRGNSLRLRTCLESSFSRSDRSSPASSCLLRPSRAASESSSCRSREPTVTDRPCSSDDRSSPLQRLTHARVRVW